MPQILTIPSISMPIDEYTKISTELNMEWTYDPRLVVNELEQKKKSIILYKHNDLIYITKREAKQKLRAGWTLLSYGFPKIQVLEAKADPASLNAELFIQVSELAVPIYPYDKWSKAAGYRVENLLSIIKETDGVKDVKISVYPRFWMLLPFSAGRINFTLDIT